MPPNLPQRQFWLLQRRREIPSAEAVVAKAFSERIVIDLELRDLLVLVRGDGDELRFTEYISPERTVRQIDNVRSADQVKTRLVLLHRVQDRLNTHQPINQREGSAHR